MVVLDKVVTDDLVRTWPTARVPLTLAPEATLGRRVGTPEEVVGLVVDAVPDVAGRVEVDG